MTAPEQLIRRYRAPVTESQDDLRRWMPLLEHPRAESGLDDDSAARLIAFTLDQGWQDHWVAFALDWIEDGLWRTEFADGLRRVVDDERSYSQQTRHRAWKYVKPGR